MTALGITISILALSPNLLRAAVVVTDAATFVIAIDANDAVSVDCSGGFVRVTDDGTPTTYTTPCASVTLLRVTADGVFDNTIDLSAVTAAAFPQLAAGGAQPVTLNGGGGNDTLTGSALGAVIRGGSRERRDVRRRGGRRVHVGSGGRQRHDPGRRGQ
jgi:hypothetical protein